jgi:hypothetical protein
MVVQMNIWLICSFPGHCPRAPVPEHAVFFAKLVGRYCPSFLEAVRHAGVIFPQNLELELQL